MNKEIVLDLPMANTCSSEDLLVFINSREVKQEHIDALDGLHILMVWIDTAHITEFSAWSKHHTEEVDGKFFNFLGLTVPKNWLSYICLWTTEHSTVEAFKEWYTAQYKQATQQIVPWYAPAGFDRGSR